MPDLSFEEIIQDVIDLSLKVKGGGKNFDFLVGVARGGWIPCRLLSSALGVKKLLSMGVMYSDTSRSKLTPYSLPDPIPVGSTLLLVEDCLESGKSLEFCANFLSQAGCNVYTASLYITDKTIYAPTYFLKQYRVPPQLPWE